MKCKKFSGAASAALIIVIAAFLLAPGALAATQYKTLYAFNGTDGRAIVAGLILDQAGNLYGTTVEGGDTENGVVFKLTPNKDGSWSESVLHSFTGADGASPQAAVIFDMVGNLYGTTYAGGASNAGTVFKLMPKGDGTWTETVLHHFTGGKDGANPEGGVILDPAGNLYGTTARGGKLSYCRGTGCGVAFELMPLADGRWTEKVLHRFALGLGEDGAYPNGLVFDPAGNLYGTTASGGAHRKGVVFRLAPNSDGIWTESVLHQFTGGKDGDTPQGDLIFDPSGNLYGMTFSGGKKASACNSDSCGVVFALTQDSEGSWKEKVLHQFDGADGSWPQSGLTLDQAGNLYGTTSSGGDLNYCHLTGCGVTFKLTPKADGNWKETVLHKFKKGGKGGYDPVAPPILDQAGNLYGTTLYGPNGWSTVFEIMP